MMTLSSQPNPDPATDDFSLCQVCKALGNTVRLQILQYVVDHPGCIGNDILLHLPEDGPHAQSTLSRHLRVLREAGLLIAEADGSATCYRVNRDCLRWLSSQFTNFYMLEPPGTGKGEPPHAPQRG
jgi:DNA-binding transcriptional ArsR family regulator